MRLGSGMIPLFMQSQVRLQEERIRQLEELALSTKGEALDATLRAKASEKLRQGANLTRPETAAYLGVSTRMIQRMEVSGKLARCPGLGWVVRYASRDVLKLASAR